MKHDCKYWASSCEILQMMYRWIQKKQNKEGFKGKYTFLLSTFIVLWGYFSAKIHRTKGYMRPNTVTPSKPARYVQSQLLHYVLLMLVLRQFCTLIFIVLQMCGALTKFASLQNNTSFSFHTFIIFESASYYLSRTGVDKTGSGAQAACRSGQRTLN